MKVYLTMRSRRLPVSAASLFMVLALCTGMVKADTRPNILWITCEDNNVDWVGCYGNPHADTPNIDGLAAEGFQYMHCYANAPVCAPSRSTWITGMLAISNGTFPMRSRHEIPHDRIPYYPDQLRAAGYYTANFVKTDFNIGGRRDSDCWDHHGEVDWDALPDRQPFFQIINLTSSHESRAQGDVENTDHDPPDTRLRAYHPDLPDVRKNYAKYHDAMKRMDGEVGEVLHRLEELGLADNTIVIHNSDHGGVLPRSKRYLFSSGLHCPLIVRIPEKYKSMWPAEQPGSQVDRLVSFVDMPKTWLSLAGAEMPGTMQGTIFLGPQAEPEPEYHFAFRGRMDERLESARAISDKRFLYIRNYMPYVPWMQHLLYLWKMKATQAWDAHVQSGKASEVEARFFAPKEWSEELYDLQEDPDNVVNLAALPEYAGTLARMRKALRTEQLRVSDAGLLPESEMIRRAAENNLTIYDMVRDPKLYDLPALLDAADLALERNLDNLPGLEKLLESPDCGQRWWATVGCFLLNARPARIDALLEDESHEVRIMAAWLLIKTGDREKGYQCLDNLLRQNDYAMLAAMNVIDWIGEDARPLMEAIPEEAQLGEYEKRMLGVLQVQFNETAEE
jgi:N-sulfoglucosamine sulfohydrolase